jgi:hypothetical protein
VPFLLGTTRSAGADGFQVHAGERQLFLDDLGVETSEKLVRTMHRPAKKGAVIRPNWRLGVTSVQVRTAPVWDAGQKLFKFWDCAASPPDLQAAGKPCTGYYESRDGLHWSQPPLGQIEYEGWQDNNYISLVANGRHVRTDYVARDPTDPDPARRFKCALPPHGFAVSPDGRRWTMLPDVAGVPSGDEANFSFDEKAHLFILTVKRGGPHGRSVHLETSKDFQTWTNHGLMFHADDLDQRLGRKMIKARFADPTLQQLVANDPSRYNVDVYNMGVFRYESMYIGTPTMYYATGPSADGTNTDGFHLVQLACSRDLKNWKRLGDCRPFIGPSRVGGGAYDLTGMIGPSNAVVRGDELWFYYTGSKYRRSPKRADTDNGAICLAVLRRDGFVSMDAGAEEGMLLTRPFEIPGPRLFVNVATPGGELRIDVLGDDGAVLARSEPSTGDLVQKRVSWRDGDLETLVGRKVRFRFRLRNAQLYSYWLR